MWSLLEKVPRALKKDEYSVVLRWNVLDITMRFIWSNVSFKALVSLLIFYLDDLYIAESGVLRSPIINILLSICLFILVNSWLM